MYDALDKVHQRFCGKIIADSAFPGQYPYLARASKTCERGPRNLQEANVEMQLVSARQPAEWGMRALQGSFPRLKARFPYKQRGHRRIVMRLIVSLHNLRSRLVGINQIRSTYMPQLQQDVSFIFPNLQE